MRLPFARIAFASSAALLVLANAQAQDINLDVAAASGTPSPAYSAGAPAAMAGAWNSISSPAGPYAAAGLLNTAGAATGVSVANVGGFGDFSFNNAATLGDDQALMDDCQDVGGAGGTTTWTFSGLSNGTYDVYTYAWAPDSGTFISNVTVPGGVPGVPVACGGNWPGAQAQGITFTKHTVAVAAGTLSVSVATVSGFGSVNGFQLDLQGATISAFCFGDNTGTICPCAPGTAGRGCANSGGNGALLTSTGSNDVSTNNLVLTFAGALPGSFAIFRQGTATLGGGLGVLSPGSDGLDCIGGTIVRIGRVSTGLTGTGSLGGIAVQGGVPPAGGLRHYQAIYRNNAAFCTPATLNGSNGLSVNWVP